MQRARTHTRFFRLVYDSPKQSDIFSGINIRIHIVPAISALERLVFSCAKMVALRTSLRSICWLNDNQRNTCHLCLILKKCSQLIKAPRVKFLLKGLVPALGSGTYLRQILNGNAYPLSLASATICVEMVWLIIVAVVLSLPLSRFRSLAHPRLHS